MQIILKLFLSIAIILTATWIGRKWPSAAGLIGVMPLTGALVLAWVYIDNKGNTQVMQNFSKGALWGILPSILFFVSAYFCFRKAMPLSLVLVFSFSVWIVAAVIHQLLLR